MIPFLLSCLLLFSGCAEKQSISPDKLQSEYKSAVEKNDMDEAQKVLLEAVQKFPDNFDFRMNLGRIYEDEGFSKKCLEFI